MMKGSRLLLMVVEYVLISTEPAKEHLVYRQLLEIEEIVEMQPLFGECDMIVRVEARDHGEIKGSTVDRIRRLAGVAQVKALTPARFTLTPRDPQAAQTS